MKTPHFFQQSNAAESGPACLGMIARYYISKEGGTTAVQPPALELEKDSLSGLSQLAEKMGFRARIVQLQYEQLASQVPLPCIVPWKQQAFAVVLPGDGLIKGKKLVCADPQQGVARLTKQQFLEQWENGVIRNGKPTASVLLLEPGISFNKENGQKGTLSWKLVMQYFRQSKWQVMQILFSLLLASMMQLMFPFLTQSVVDVGINSRDLDYITVILLAQLMLVFSRTIIDFIRIHLLLYVATWLNLSILSDFWIKLTRLPIPYFDRNHTGEILQRIEDNRQVQEFMTGPALNTVFSMLNFIVFAIALIMYKVDLFLVFVAGVVLYFLWMLAFLNLRRKINYSIFHMSARENNVTLQLVQGMQEIRLHNIQQSKRWEWESLQAEIFKLKQKNISYNQYQIAGAVLINQVKDVILIFLVAKFVMEGQLTLGSMLAIQFITAQLNGPIEQFIHFVQDAQNAKISMERLNEVHTLEEEERSGKKYVRHLPVSKTIRLEDLSFAYPGQGNQQVLHNICLEIPQGKTTAIVGVSGSGKTTLIKLLLKFYDEYGGSIRIGNVDFNNIDPSFWRTQCGAVLQDGFIFNDTVARNIAVEYDQPDHTRLIEACKTANILSFIESLPRGFNTRLGVDGVGISEGQKQRLLIARAVYRQPAFLFFDESTNALDANNEKVILENLQSFFEKKTVVVIAHRLSTVKNADKIIVINKGVIMEEGTHHELSQLKGRYYELVRNQLELGN